MKQKKAMQALYKLEQSIISLVKVYPSLSLSPTTLIYIGTKTTGNQYNFYVLQHKTIVISILFNNFALESH